jgi:hypothetical protein
LYIFLSVFDGLFGKEKLIQWRNNQVELPHTVGLFEEFTVDLRHFLEIKISTSLFVTVRNGLS